MKSILQTFIMLLFLILAQGLWGQCSITSATATTVSCKNQGTVSPADDAIQFNLNVAATSGSSQGFWINVNNGTTVTPQEGTYGSAFAVVLGNGSAGSGQSYSLTITDKSDSFCSRTVVVSPQASCSVFDLALTNVLNTAAPYTYGQTHNFTITVFSQGNVTATDIVVNDYIPDGYTFAPNNGWTGSAPTITRTIAGPLTPGASVTVSLDLVVTRITTPTTNKSWVNYSGIASAEDGAGNPAFDADSTPGSNGTNENTILPNGPGDNDTSSTSDTGVGSQDDHDPAGPKIFDLALRKIKLTATPSFSYGQTVMYQIEVLNQGNIPATNINISDYLPCGLELSNTSATNAGWSLVGSRVTRTFTGVLNPGQGTILLLDLIVRECYTGDVNIAWTNYAEITSADDTDPNTPTLPTDIDSTPDAVNGNDAGGVPNFGGVSSGTDDTIDNENGDEDDHDPVKIEVFDLALRKTLVTPAPYNWGQPLTFNVEVFNQGNVTATNIVVSDYIPVGFTFTDNNGWTGGPSIARRTITGPIAPGASISFPLVLTLQQNGGGGTAWNSYAEITSSKDDRNNNRFDDADSVADDNPGNDNSILPGDPNDDLITGGGPNADPDEDEDDHDPGRIEIIDLALRKTLITAGPYAYGDLLQFNIEVFNQGNEPMRNTRITEYIPAGYIFSAGDNLGWTGVAPNPTYLIEGPLMPATSQMITINLRIQQTTGGEKHWINYAEITDTYNNDLEPRNNWEIDSNPGSNSTAENVVEPGFPADDNITSIDKGGEEDDHDPAGIEIYDLAMRKVTTVTGPFRYGDIVKFTYEVFNQGSIQASGIDLVDYIPCGMRYVAASNNALGWAYNATTGNATVTLSGSLIPGASRTIDIYLQVQPCIVGSTTAWTNIGEIAGGDSDDPSEPPTDIDSDPDTDPVNDGGEPDGPNDDVVDEDPDLPGDDDEDDHDHERLEIVDLALRKRMVTTGPYRYGQVLDFDIDVFNQGNVTMTNIKVSDYIPEGFTYDPAINADWQGAYPEVFTIISEPLAPEASTTVRLRLKLEQSNGGARVYTNSAEITGMDDENGSPRDNGDADSTPNNNNNPVNLGDPNDDVVDESPNDPNRPGDDDEDDNDPAGPKVFDLALRKVQLTALRSFSYGQTVMFGISIFNQGNVDAKDIVIIDTLPCGLEYIVTPSNTAAGWVYNPATREIRTTYRSVLAAGASVQLTLDNRVIPCYTNVRRAWTNWAEIGSADDNDPTTPTPPVDLDSTPDNNNNNDPGGQPNTPEDDEINGDPNNPNNPGASQDEDDHDPNQIQVFDLALRKTVDDGGPYTIGETATFRIEIFNQGNVPARNIVINDYMRSGFTFNVAANPGWTLTTAPTSSTIGLLNYVISSTLMPGQSLILPLNLIVAFDANPVVNDWWNYAEIRSAMDNVGNNRDDDADSVANSNSTRENGVEPNGPFDNVINGNGVNFNQDEDDHDTANLCNSITCVCDKPVLTIGNFTCNISTYSLVIIHNGQTITSSAGTVSGNRVNNIPIGTNVFITSSNGIGCTTELTYTSPASCVTTCNYPNLTVGQPICVGTTYTVSMTETTGATISLSVGTRVGNTVTNIPIGSNVTIIATNGGCVSQIVVTSPTGCIDICSNPPISISGPVCTNNNINYRVNYTKITGSTISASHGTVTNDAIIDIPAGQALTITVTIPGCPNEVVVVPAPACVCDKPVLTIGNFTCNISTYSLVIIHNGQTITSSAGTVSGNRVNNIPIGTNVFITSSNGIGCTTELTYTSPASCVTTCNYPNLTVGQPICVGTTYTVSMTETTGATISLSVGTRVGNTVTNIPIGSNVTIIATNGGCVSQIVVTSPTGCIDICSNPPISISGPVCTNNNINYRVNYTKITGSTISASHGTVTNDAIINIPAGQALTITVTIPGCPNEVVVVPAPACVCDKPVLTIGNFTCNISTYSLVIIHNGQTITSSAGTVSGNRVNNIPIGTNVFITSSNGIGCTTELTYTSPASCLTTCNYPNLTVGQPICVGTTYTVSMTETTGATISLSVGTRVGNTVTNIPIGSNVTIIATNGGCVSQIVVTSPTGCIDICSNPPISISGPVCTNNNINYRVNYTKITGSTISASHGTVTNDAIINIPAGQALTITVTIPGCPNEVVVVPAPSCQVASIGNFVWHDLDGNGQQNAGEPGIAGVQVNLYKGDRSYVGTTYTGVNGFYLFDFLNPGDYYLEFIDPAGFESTFFNRGSDMTDSDVDRSNGPRTTATINLAPGVRDMTRDAGYYECIPIGDLVWYDINKNDVWDTNENGINGLRVNLWRNHFGTWLIWDHKFTGNKPGTPSDDGYYKFCAPPGEYYVEVIMPPLGLVRARANVGTNEKNDSDITNANGPTTTDKFTVSSGQEKCDLGAGFYPQATAGNLVWVDANANGVQEAQEARMSGVLVEAVMLSNGQVTESAVTDADGVYMIEGLEKQQYFLKFTPPAGYFATVPRATVDNMDSDVDGSYGPNTTRAFDMQPANAYENIDMGLSFAPLPVEWLDVTARRVNNTHLIDWSVARESNVSHYEVERRFGSEKEFYTIPGKVLAKGNTNEVTNYNLSDLDVDKSGIYVYRVKQYDFDGKSSYSKLVKVSHNGENSIELYPNPARNETNVQIVVSQDAVVSVEMYDAASKLVKVIKVSDVQVAGDMIYNANLQDVPAGVYNVVITIDGVQTQRKLIRIE